MKSGGLAILNGRLINLFVVTHYYSLILKSSPYEPEAIAIIGAFYSLGPSIRYGHIYTDCKSLVIPFLLTTPLSTPMIFGSPPSVNYKNYFLFRLPGHKATLRIENLQRNGHTTTLVIIMLMR